MKFYVNSKEFNNAIKRIIPIAKRYKGGAFQFLAGLIIRANENGVFIESNSQEHKCKLAIPYVKIEEYGVATLYYAELEKIGAVKGVFAIQADECGENKPCYAKSDKKKMTVAQVAKLNDMIEYYEVEQTADNDFMDIQNGQDFIKSIKTVSAAVLDNMSKPIYTGILFDSVDKGIVAIDGFRMIVRKCDWWTNNGTKAVAAGFINADLNKLIGKATDGLKVYCDGKHITFYGKDFVYTSRLLDGYFLEWKQVVPKDVTAEFAVENVKEFTEILKEYKKYSKNEKGINSPTRIMNYDGDILMNINTVTYKTTDLVKAKDEVTAEIDCGFNCGYLLDAVNVFDKEEFVFKYSGTLKPLILENAEYLALVVPMRISDESYTADEIRNDFAA